MNKLKQDKKKYIIENRNINDIKLNYQNMIITSKKDKETIKNLKNQISDLKNLIKAKPNKTENKNLRNTTTKINMAIINKKSNKKNNNGNNDNDKKNKKKMI